MTKHLHVRFFEPGEWGGTSHREWQLSSLDSGEGILVASLEKDLLIQAESLSESSSGWSAKIDGQWGVIDVEHAVLADSLEDGWAEFEDDGFVKIDDTTCIDLG